MDKKGRARMFTRLAALGLAGGLLWCGTLGSVNAATLKDLFDEHYYADLYKDLKAAYGYDVLALWMHYHTAGAEENREARSEEIVQEEIKAEREAAKKVEAEAAQKPQETPKPGAHTEKVEYSNGGWRIDEYNEAGQRIKNTSCNEDGSVSSWTEYEYDEKTTGKIIKALLTTPMAQ